MTDSNAIQVLQQATPGGLAMTVDQAIDRYNAVVEFTKRVMKPNKDYGAVPGAGDKPTLLKPGAEKLCSLFGFAPQFVKTDSIVDFDKGMFYMEYRCELWRGGQIVATGIGSCNSHETKYRYRKGERVCPQCGKAAIITGKAEYGGGFICFTKKGGCGEKYKADDARITGQQVGRIENPDPADLLNTISKMAQKRALVAAVLIGANASEFYTQDIEDMGYIDGEYSEAPAQQQPRQQTTPRSYPSASAGGFDQAQVEYNDANYPPLDPEPEAPRQQPARTGKPQAFNPVASLVEWGISENMPAAAGLMTRYAKTHPGAVDADALKAWATLYRKWRDAGSDTNAAAENADAGAQI